MKIFAVSYALAMLCLIAAQVWLCVISPPFILVALFTIPWGMFFATGLLISEFDRENGFHQ